MKRNAMHKNVRRTIRKSLGRYIAIVAIIALGAGMFVGLLSTKSDMVATAQKFTDDMEMFDLRLLSTYGWAAEDVDAVARMSGVADAEGAISMDVIGTCGEDQEEGVYRLHSVPERIDKVYLLGGRMPQSPDECLVDGSHADDGVLGTRFIISAGNEPDTLESLSVTTFTVVGYVSTPLYMDMSRGSTTLGNGDLSNYIYIPSDAFAVDYYTEIGVTIEGTYEVYTDEFTEAMERMAEQLDPGVTLLAQERYLKLREDAQKEYDEGLTEYEDGLAEYGTGRQEVLDKLAEAFAELQSGQAQIDANRAELLDGQTQLDEAQAQIDENAVQLAQSRQELADSKAEAYTRFAEGYAELSANQKEVSAGLTQVQDGLAQLDDGIGQLEDGLEEIDSGIEQLHLLIGIQETVAETTQSLLEMAQNASMVDPSLVSQLETQLSEAQQKLSDYDTQRQALVDMQTEYSQQLADLQTQRAELAQTEQTLLDSMAAIEQGATDLEFAQAEAENRFASAEAQIEAGEQQLTAAQKELDARKAELEEGKAALEQAQEALYQGQAEYKQGKLDAEAELAEAEAQLADAKAQLDDGRQLIADMAQPEVYILDRNTNVGYLAVDSNSDIVAGVSRVFPAFFLLVAALVCITTMTRMVDEERTQIGILKALGYSNGAIIRKYLFYSGSAAVLGCGLGVIVGSIVFPEILWAAYSIILALTPDIVLKLDWPLCLAVVAAYTAVSMLVTWYCCRRELKEVPAELIRPKAPAAGKKILLEYLPFWKKIGFLDKVMFRNVFRYKQRLLMMLVGIGGCTALLLTGFGVGDSIKDIVDYQYAEVTVYDMSVYFSEGQDLQAQTRFRQELDADEVLFYHQSSVDLQFGDQTREVYLVASDESIGDFIDFHSGDDPLGMPGTGETYLSIGAAEAMGVGVGDTVTVRNVDMDTMDLTVAGIFDNHVHNYVIVRPETVEEAWGEAPAYQMAFVNVREGQDVHAVGAKIAGMAGVMNVSISQDIAEQVGSMLDAMDLIVVTIVICAGLLAGIVLYNLTNISITERIREIATIKVLGFSSGETAAYVFKENLFLSGMGTLVGLGGGVLLLEFVMSQIKIDMVWFQARMEPMSFVWAVVLTMLSACLVDFVLYFKLERINMAEALKSVE